MLSLYWVIGCVVCIGHLDVQFVSGTWMNRSLGCAVSIWHLDVQFVLSTWMCSLYQALGCGGHLDVQFISGTWMCSLYWALGCAALYQALGCAVCIRHLDVQFYIRHWMCSLYWAHRCAVLIGHMNVQFLNGLLRHYFVVNVIIILMPSMQTQTLECVGLNSPCGNLTHVPKISQWGKG